MRDIVRLLEAEGYKAVYENGYPVILLGSDQYGKKGPMGKIRKTLKSLGWNRSYGVRLHEENPGTGGVSPEKEGRLRPKKI